MSFNPFKFETNTADCSSYRIVELKDKVATFSSDSKVDDDIFGAVCRFFDFRIGKLNNQFIVDGLSDRHSPVVNLLHL